VSAQRSVQKEGDVRVTTKVKAGRLAANHNTTVVDRGTGMTIKTTVKAGRLSANHNTTVR
jgi:hypothetical protein